MELDKNIKLIKQIKKYPTIGWREWVGLPELGIARIKAKVDTGARTSALHAFSLQPFMENGKQRIRFDLHPIQHDLDSVVTCVADVVDRRLVTDSGGHTEERYVIMTTLAMAGQSWPIEITLTERETMLFRMLLGRKALRKRFIVNPARSFVTTRVKQK
jgi:hypothetical protein